MRALCILLLLPLGPVLALEPAENPGASAQTLRITNRRWISHMAFEPCAPEFCVTLLVTHPGQWAWHADSHSLKYLCNNPADCVEVMRRIDAHLVSGENLIFQTEGARITRIQFLSRSDMRK